MSSLHITNNQLCSIRPLLDNMNIQLSGFEIIMYLGVSCPMCHITKDVKAQPSSFLQNLVVGCSGCHQTECLGNVGDLVYASFVYWGCYSPDELVAWKDVFTSTEVLKTLKEVSPIIYGFQL